MILYGFQLILAYSSFKTPKDPVLLQLLGARVAPRQGGPLGWPSRRQRAGAAGLENGPTGLKTARKWLRKKASYLLASHLIDLNLHPFGAVHGRSCVEGMSKVI